MARRLVMLLVAVCFGMFVFAAAGCGGDDESSASEDTTLTETTTTEETTEEETTEEETTDTDTETEDTETTETSASGDVAENCEEFAQVGARVSEAVSGSADVDEIKTAFDELAAAAPDEIRGDFETLAGYMTTVAEAIGDVGPGETPDPSALAKLAALDATAATTASTNIAAWVTENCSGAGATP